jgi:uncharacterized protein involved in exopolysaccharide biosynthesis/Mrp family chromosome partitioning ATPase
MHRRLALAFAVAGLILASAYLFRYWSVYTAQSLVYIQPTPTEVREGAPVHWTQSYDPVTYEAFVEQQMVSMTRDDVLVGAVHKLAAGVWQQSGESDESAAQRLRGAIEVTRVKNSYQVSITAHSFNPETAADLANAVAASYIDDTSHEQKAGDAVRVAMLKEERDRIKKELDGDRAEQAALNAQLGVAAIGPASPDHYDDDIAKIHDELVKARADHDQAAARLTAMNAGNGPNSTAMDAEADQLITADPGLASLKAALLQRRAALVSQMANLTPNHPQYKQDEAELAKIDASLDSATKDLRAKAAARIQEQLRTDLDRTSGVEARLNGELAQMTRAAASATPRLQRASDLANDITRLQNRYSTVDEQLQNQILEDSAPGTAHLSVAAVAPLHPAIFGVVRNAIVLFLAFVFFGLAAAVIAQKMDPRIYIAGDVEQLLGFAPMAQLPDFAEVSGEVVDEHLLRLAAGIEYACKEGGMRSCIFTGAGPEAGVTTVATRVKEMLESMGRPTQLVNASEYAAAETRSGLGRDQAQPAARSTALLQHVAEEAENGDQSLVLTDTAPLTVSAETEYLARFADCTIVVVESGVTTRAQVRAAASRLHRLNVAAVGFVLNRVGLAKADPAFRHSVEAVERHIRAQSRFAARQAPSSRLVTAEPVSASVELAAPAVSAAALARTALTAAMTGAPEGTTVAAAPAPIAQSQTKAAQPQPVVAHPAPALPKVRLDPERVSALPASKPAWQELEPIVATPPVLPSVPKEFDPIVATPPVSPKVKPEPQPVAAPPAPALPAARPESEPVAASPSDIPWWLTEAPARATPLEQFVKAHAPHTRVGSWQTELAGEGGTETAAVVAVEEKPHATPSRLNGLRGLFFALGLKEEGHPAPQASEAAPAPQPERTVSLQTAPVQVAPVPAPPEHAVPAQTFVPTPEPEPAFTAARGNGLRKDSTRRVTAEPEFLPPKPEKLARRDRRDAFDDVQILPSWRGQYKRKS